MYLNLSTSFQWVILQFTFYHVCILSNQCYCILLIDCSVYGDASSGNQDHQTELTPTWASGRASSDGVLMLN